MWLLEHYPAGEDWEKSFDTEAEALEELRKHICQECMTGKLVYVDSSLPNGVGEEQRPVPNPESAYDLLSTPCGCEYGLTEE